MRKNAKVPNFLQSKQDDDRPIPELYENLYLPEETPATPLADLKHLKNCKKPAKTPKNEASR